MRSAPYTAYTRLMRLCAPAHSNKHNDVHAVKSNIYEMTKQINVCSICLVNFPDTICWSSFWLYLYKIYAKLANSNAVKMNAMKSTFPANKSKTEQQTNGKHQQRQTLRIRTSITFYFTLNIYWNTMANGCTYDSIQCTHRSAYTHTHSI